MANLKLFFWSFFKLKSLSLEGRSLMTEESSLNRNCVFTQIIPDAVSHQVMQQQKTIFVKRTSFDLWKWNCSSNDSDCKTHPRSCFSYILWEVLSWINRDWEKQANKLQDINKKSENFEFVSFFLHKFFTDAFTGKCTMYSTTCWLPTATSNPVFWF